MKKISLLASLVYVVVATSAQDTTFYSKRWQSYFTDYTKEQYVNYEVADFNKKYKYDQFYNCLVVYKDSTRAPKEFKMKFKSIQNLCDPKATLGGKDYKVAQEYLVDKKSLKYFVFDDMAFVYDGIVRKKYKVALKPDYWSLVLIDGPIRFTRYYYTSTMASGTVLDMAVGRIQKYEDDLGSDLNTMGVLASKSSLPKPLAIILSW